MASGSTTVAGISRPAPRAGHKSVSVFVKYPFFVMTDDSSDSPPLDAFVWTPEHNSARLILARGGGVMVPDPEQVRLHTLTPEQRAKLRSDRMFARMLEGRDSPEPLGMEECEQMTGNDIEEEARRRRAVFDGDTCTMNTSKPEFNLLDPLGLDVVPVRWQFIDCLGEDENK